ncbi:ArsA family ATPase [Streptomyces sp. Je 1-4]|uniref:ArsA family ATPase n=1 Tax=Streptomyces TaxID=1883 RepID=UPI00140EA93C|nr:MULTISPECIES: ArsA-related P-loop ATPase [unclassified Streptomyces]QIK09188.1 ArsA family ATPase [Streptomyces sp. ID38640]UYB42885.1 ArsA family ATPase [Streptomyces sp. Je 1-4]UZQ39218.1 ArsA family ATPase [Streptomyces sp. Je 1-4] [Streptomyces sp. Je 1-4 4N24]UZQ46635.1 ArsA family ATPase [Streptomyces sp. Je 1-4] [Streptomyces sp. Je 1-4 4N24_ara]
MRIVLVTGSGGAGRTTLAAATALAGARRGERALLLTTGSSAPETVLGTPLGADAPTPIAPGLHARRIDPGDRFRQEFLAFQERAGAALDLLGAAPLDEDELTELPGSEDFALLHALRAEHASDDWDLVVVDMPSADETVRLLALPAQVRRYLRRLLPPERQAARALRPVLAQLAGVPMPAQKLYDAAERWETELAAVQRTIDDPGTSVRLVTEAGPVAAATLRTLRAGLALHGRRTDGVVVNRLLPTGSADPFLAALSGSQQTALKALREEFPDLPVHEVPHLGRDPQGVDELDELIGGPVGEIGAAAPADGLPHPDPWTVEDRLAADGILVWRVPLPGAERKGLGLVRRGDEIVVTVGRFRRIRTLPSALRRCTVSGAGLRDGALEIRFTPDPDLWPKSD